MFCAKGDKDEIFYEIRFESIKAPVSERQVVGQIVVYKNNVEADRLNLIANESVGKLSYFDSLKSIADRWLI